MKVLNKVFVIILISSLGKAVFAKTSPSHCFEMAKWTLSDKEKIALCAGSYNDSQAPVDCFDSARWTLSNKEKIVLCAPKPSLAAKILKFYQ